MPIIDSHLQGNWGEQYISEILSAKGCLVRHVPQGHDTGIDLYCESTAKIDNLENRPSMEAYIPFLHFWCQIKTDGRLKARKKIVKLRADQEHIDYWLKQPIPVFIFKTPDGRGKEFVPYYIYNAVHFRISNTEAIDPILKVEKPEDINFFIANLPIQYALWELMHGKASHIKTAEPKYIIEFPSGVAQIFEHELKNSLFWTLYRLVNDMLFHGWGVGADEILKKRSFDKERMSKLLNFARPYAKTFDTFMTETGDMHYAYLVTLGAFFDLDEKYPESLEYYKKSLESLNADPEYRRDIGEEVWQQMVSYVEFLIEKVESHL